jgi:protein tyrosine phosphatase
MTKNKFLAARFVTFLLSFSGIENLLNIVLFTCQDNPGTVRTVTQFHYTAWPDKDVPRSTTSLLHFWYRVRKHDEEKERPWLVHCR